MLIELKLLGLRIEIDPKTVEALLEFIVIMVGCQHDEKSASSDNQILE